MFGGATEQIGNFKDWLTEQNKAGDSQLAAAAIGTAQFVATLGEGITRPLDIAANLAQVATGVDDQQVRDELAGTKQALSSAKDFVVNGDYAQAAKNVHQAAVNETVKAMEGDVTATANVTQAVLAAATLKSATKGKPKITTESVSGPVTKARNITPELQKRADAFRKYKENKALSKTDKVTKEQFANFKRGNAGQNGQQLYAPKSNYKTPEVKPVHANSHSATGPHDIYVVRNAKTGEVLRFGETGRALDVRLTEHVRKMKKEHDFNEDVVIDKLKTVDGKGAAKVIENKYIKTYEKLYKQRPPFNFNDH